MMSDDDNVIRFPGAGSEEPVEKTSSGVDGDTQAMDMASVLAAAGLSADQQKAIGVVLDGMSFVCVGIKPTGSGADFFTAVHGNPDELSDAGPHLAGVIERAFARHGLDWDA